MSQEDRTPAEDDKPLPAQSSHCASGSTESETSDDLSEASDTALFGATSVLPRRKRRRRTIIGADQLMKMEQLYKQEQWPGREKKEALAREIGMSTHFVNIWFQNKRSRMKKLAQEEEELEILRQSRSPGTTVKLDSAPGPSMLTKPIAIAPKPAFGNPIRSPLTPVRIPKVGQCVVLGHNISVSSGSTAATPVQASGASIHPSPTVKVQNTTSSSKKHSRIQSLQTSTAPPKPPTSLRPQQLSVSSLGLPLRRTNHAPLSMPETTGQLNFFKCLVSMMALEEGGLIKKGDPVFDVAVNAALYGLRMANGNILTYRKNRGLFIHNDQ
ncbi:LIM homeobox transcription factor 1-alpha-like [Patiria miniata]|uniref:Homeobox domain-containing protein n=1 Tax=Patiria miniata TaxID=46514 RepID=A0A913Z5J5_PATMI|nr:LIM homeobox transcription factor 1-alpha-like [Patiria miniata]